MASTQKRTSSSSGGGSRSRASSNSSNSGKRTTSQSKAQGKRSSSRKSAPQKKPYRRELGGVACLLMALFGAIGYFVSEGFVITWFCNLLKGMLGYGFYLAPPLFLAAAGILIFHRGRPVCLRVTGTLALPVLAGSIFHLLLCRTEYEWGWRRAWPPFPACPAPAPPFPLGWRWGSTGILPCGFPFCCPCPPYSGPPC